MIIDTILIKMCICKNKLIFWSYYRSNNFHDNLKIIFISNIHNIENLINR